MKKKKSLKPPMLGADFRHMENALPGWERTSDTWKMLSHVGSGFPTRGKCSTMLGNDFRRLENVLPTWERISGMFLKVKRFET